MDSHWTDENKIDGIYTGQERNEPINIYNGLNIKTPGNYLFDEELEDAGSSEDNDFQSRPDLHLIHQVLHLVKDTKVHTENAQDTEKIVEIKKFPNSTEANFNVTTDNSEDIKLLLKKKKQRNVAIESVIERITNECTLMSLEINEIGYKNEQQVKLLKPEDFVLKSESSTELSESNNECDIPIKGLITEASAFVFKKKSPEVSNIRDSPKLATKSDAYQPSSMAEIYYKKYLERSKFKERLQLSTEEFYERIKSKVGIEAVQLPYHRHLVAQDCIVCKLICRKFFE